jgi:hypothetical protein
MKYKTYIIHSLTSRLYKILLLFTPSLKYCAAYEYNHLIITCSFFIISSSPTVDL